MISLRECEKYLNCEQVAETAAVAAKGNPCASNKTVEVVNRLAGKRLMTIPQQFILVPKDPIGETTDTKERGPSSESEKKLEPPEKEKPQETNVETPTTDKKSEVPIEKPQPPKTLIREKVWAVTMRVAYIGVFCTINSTEYSASAL